MKKLILILIISLIICFNQIQYSDAVCCMWLNNNYDLRNYGKGSCNILGCNCDGGCSNYF